MNIIDYVSSQHEPLTRFNMNEADMFVLTALSYISFAGCGSFDSTEKLGNLANELLALTLVFREEKFKNFLAALAKSGRFFNLGICGYRDEHNAIDDTLQFSAVTIKIADNLWFISYSGTDGTVVGWKEDFQFAYMEQTSAQRKALEYIDEASQKLKGNFIVSGHSKGGNLAAYASIFSPKYIQDRIIGIYCNDAPGFNEKLDVYSTDGYMNISEKVRCFIPQDAIIGRLLQTFPKKHFTVIRSVAESVIYQHDIFNWQLTEYGLPMIESGLNTFTDISMDIVNRVISHIPQKGKKDLTDALFDIFEKGNVQHLNLDYLLSNLPVRFAKWVAYYKIGGFFT